ncbi:MAG: hypothetical protein AAB393_17310, partial [Bacteroidota bacterium]
TLYTINLTTGATTVVGQMMPIPSVIGMAISPSGQMYAYGLDDQFYSVNKATGTSTLIGPIGFDANFAQDMDYDFLTDVLYMAAYNNATSRGELRTVDISTGATTLVGVLGTTQSLIDPFAIKGPSGGAIRWLSIRPTSGCIAVNDSVQMTAVFDGNVNPLSEYRALIRIVAPDYPSADTLNILVRMLLWFSDPPIIILDRDSVNFGDVYIGRTDSSQTILVRNGGLGTLHVTNITITDTAFSVSPRAFSLYSMDTT